MSEPTGCDLIALSTFTDTSSIIFFMAQQPAKLFGFAAAIGLLGFAPFLLLSQSQFLLPKERAFHFDLFDPKSAANSSQPTASVARLEVSLDSRKVALYQGNQLIKTYPIAIGREGWETPTGTFHVHQMIQNPAWIQPFTDELISVDDPRNPLGGYWIGFWSDGRNAIGFHGTPDPGSVGSAVSHGCLRMYTEDIQELFQRVQPNTVVTVKR